MLFPAILESKGYRNPRSQTRAQRNFGLIRDLSDQAQPIVQKEKLMSSTADKVKGTANEAIGKTKQGIGEAVGSDKMQGEGAVQEIKGKGQKAVGDAKEATKDAVNKAAAAANKNL
jgi:uncharacterized protein YjbJ (UPF0337 family)